MNAKEMSFGFLRTVRKFPAQVFFFIALLSFSVAPSQASPSCTPFRTELHEKALSRVSQQTCTYRIATAYRETFITPEYAFTLEVTHIRISHYLKIFKKEKSHFNNRNGFHLRLHQVTDAAHSLI
jgi:hypothetical protein